MTKKILFFIEGSVPTEAEQTQIDALNDLTNPGYEVGVRSSAQNPEYGYGIEECDLVAGDIPTAYSEVEDYGLAHADRPVLFHVCGHDEDVEVGATRKLHAIAVIGTDVSNLDVEHVNAAADGTTWSSSDEAKATVSTNGTVTGVSAGAVTITATYEYDGDGATVTSTAALTITA